MINIFKLSPNARDVRESLEQELKDTNSDFVKEGFMVMGGALCLLSRFSDGSKFYLIEEYDLTPTHEQGFKTVINSDVAFRKEIEYISGLVVDVCFLKQWRILNLVNFDRQVTLTQQEESLIQTRVKEEMHGDQIVIFKEPI